MIDVEVDRHRRCINVWDLKEKTQEGTYRSPKWVITFERLEEIAERLTYRKSVVMLATSYDEGKQAT
mgnify:CR=1 FL=1